MLREELAKQVCRWKLLGRKIVFTNGCFDILHKGHLALLSQAAAAGDVLIVGINADDSVRRLKGDERPVNDESFRGQLLASLSIIDAVCIFPEDTPLELIQTILPDFLIKGGDYDPATVVGAEDVIKNGGELLIIPLVAGYSTSNIIQKIREL
ncbi:MAG: D-glycero-beta-D-manno-heptose 1-phosphate adenylyltransferase [Chitinophagaceae bacterium]